MPPPDQEYLSLLLARARQLLADAERIREASAALRRELQATRRRSGPSTDTDTDRDGAPDEEQS